MEHVVSAVTGELVIRFISFLMSKYSRSHEISEEKQLKRLQQLLLCDSMVVEEADGCHVQRPPCPGHVQVQDPIQEDPIKEITSCFGRHTEKQRLLNFLLEYNPPALQPAVLPIIGGLGVGKKTLVAHVCGDERVQSQFSSILHLNEDVNEMNWEEFYNSVAQMNDGSKVVTISRLRKSEKLGAVKPMFLNNHSDEELSYLFKTLAFGSANPKDLPRLVQIAEEIAMQMQFIGTLAAANATADALRRDLDVNFWLGRLKMCITLTEKNFLYGQNPKLLLEQGRRIEITSFAFSPTAPLHLIPCTNFSSASKVTMKNLPRVRSRELLLDPSIRPKGEFNLVTWESRLPPYTSFVHFVPNCAQVMPEDTPFLGRKRRGIPS
uniref:NB-ARC domain-containing protein n=1 Tax=Oryza punctata TaxID=4537 RepID=A0A0E0M5B1_ORYPU